jgi:hypothetical protein
MGNQLLRFARLALAVARRIAPPRFSNFACPTDRPAGLLAALLLKEHLRLTYRAAEDLLRLSGRLRRHAVPMACSPVPATTARPTTHGRSGPWRGNPCGGSSRKRGRSAGSRKGGAGQTGRGRRHLRRPCCFFVLPLGHSERIALLERCVTLCAALVDEAPEHLRKVYAFSASQALPGEAGPAVGAPLHGARLLRDCNEQRARCGRQDDAGGVRAAMAQTSVG